MAEKQDMSQEVSRLLRVVAALISGSPLQLDTETLPVEVVAIMRDNWPSAPVYVQYATADGWETVPLDELAIAE